jgi:DivIVA domain-containing protein
MSDEQFRLTPLDVRRWEFGSALRGYDRARVDEFKSRVADEIEELARRINDLDTKARGFHDQIRSFRERDRAINDALTGILFTDDCQVVSMSMTKGYSGDRRAGAYITVSRHLNQMEKPMKGRKRIASPVPEDPPGDDPRD